MRHVPEAAQAHVVWALPQRSILLGRVPEGALETHKIVCKLKAGVGSERAKGKGKGKEEGEEEEDAGEVD